ncbi:MAG TPA: segregation/condensation protein A, partial [Anaerolineaceae bacterium]
VSAPPRMEPRADLSGFNLNDLRLLAREVFTGAVDLPALSEVVAAPRITIREKIRSILDILRQNNSITFQRLLAEKRSRLEIVVTFLAMLELVKRHIVDAQQSGLFQEIELAPVGEWDESQEENIEFE